MSTTRAATPRVPWNRRGILQSLLVGGALGASFFGCSFGWDGLDPRLGGSGGGAATTGGTGGSGPVTSAGGASSTTVTSGAITSSGVGEASSSATGSASGTGGASDTSSSSTGTGGSGGGPVHCGGTSVLTDDFPGGDPGDLWDLNSNGTMISETGGEAVIAIPSNSPNGSWGEFDSKRAYDFRGDSISVELTGVTNPLTTAQSWFGTGIDSDNYLQMYQKKGILHLDYHLGGVVTSLKTTTFDPVAHRHWRLREDGTTTFWETSSDGASWTTMAQAPTATLFPMNIMWVWFGAGSDGGEVNPGAAKFDHLNGGGAPKEKWCPASSMKDDFNDGVRSPAWARGWEDMPGMLAETGGKLVISLVPNQSTSAAYVASSSLDLTGSSVLLEVPSVVSAADGSETRVILQAPGDQEIEMSESQGHLHFSIKKLNMWQELGSVLYAPVQHRWWRIRETAGTLSWDTSPDGKTWTAQAQIAPAPFPIDALDLFLEGNGWAAQANPGISSFDNLNLPPP